MTRRVLMISLSLLFLVVPVLGGDLPRVLQPNETAYSASEVTALTQAITALGTALNNYNLGSRRYFASNDWNSRDFAAYTGGTLSEMGYETVLVSAAGWPDGVHTWVLVGIPLGGKTAWVPVEASPVAGHSQQVLGYIPSTTDGAGRLWFEGSYLNFNDVTELPPNLPPVAKIRPPTGVVATNSSVKFLTLGSYDPDGEIVLYLWDFGDGTTSVHTSPVYRYVYGKKGDYTLTLTVIDNRGKPATTSVDVRVGQREEIPPPSSSDGCGCGG